MEDNYVLKQKELINNIEKFSIEGDNKATIVEMRDDYENDDQICLTSVVFIPEDIADKIITKIIKPLKQIEPGHYYYPTESMHFTVKNIRTINNPPSFTESDILKVDQIFKEVISECSPFSLYIEEAIKFPTSISLMAYSSSVLGDLVKNLDNGLNKIGVTDNKKYFSNSVFFGNITICRFTHDPSKKLRNKIKKMRNIKIGEMKAEEINLITCNSVCSKKSRKVISKYRIGSG